MMTTTKTTEITVRARAFTGHGIQTVSCLVDPDGHVTVWDEIAGHYTICHAITSRAARRIRRLAARLEAVRA